MRSRRALTYAPGRDWPEGHSLTSPPGVSRQAPETGTQTESRVPLCPPPKKTEGCVPTTDPGCSTLYHTKQPHPSPSLSVLPARRHQMPFNRPPPPSSSSSASVHSPDSIEHSSSSSSSLPSLTSEDSSASTSDFEALASPLKRLSLRDKFHSPIKTRKPDVDDDSAAFVHDRRAIEFDSSEDDLTQESMLDREFRQERRSMGREVELSKGREGTRSHPVVSAL